MISIILPTYNEKENIETIVREIFSTVKKGTEVVIVDDNSPDGTGEIADRLAKKYNVKIIHRSKRFGLSPAVITGLKVAKGDIIGVMDADLSHPPELIPQMITLLKRGTADIVIGSRYSVGGSVETWSFFRKLVSQFATFLAKCLVDIKDPMSGYFFMKKSVVNNVVLNSKGYKILLEILVKGHYSRIVEIPYTFRGRGIGKSKLTIKEYMKYLKDWLKLVCYKTF